SPFLYVTNCLTPAFDIVPHFIYFYVFHIQQFCQKNLIAPQHSPLAGFCAATLVCKILKHYAFLTPKFLV
ncbi:MAG: hypothetical protein RR954_03945, partial [Christensenellaceae bacterium]